MEYVKITRMTSTIAATRTTTKTLLLKNKKIDNKKIEACGHQNLISLQLLYHPQQIVAITTFYQWRSNGFKLLRIYKAHAVGNFFYTSYL